MKLDHYDKVIEKALTERTYHQVATEISHIIGYNNVFDNVKEDDLTILMSQSDYTIVVMHHVSLLGKIDPNNVKFTGIRIKVSHCDQLRVMSEKHCVGI